MTIKEIQDRLPEHWHAQQTGSVIQISECDAPTFIILEPSCSRLCRHCDGEGAIQPEVGFCEHCKGSGIAESAAEICLIMPIEKLLREELFPYVGVEGIINWIGNFKEVIFLLHELFPNHKMFEIGVEREGT